MSDLIDVLLIVVVGGLLAIGSAVFVRWLARGGNDG